MYEAEDMFREKIIGGKCGRDTPGHMPNPEVKPASVDGTVRGTHGRADHCQFRFNKRKFHFHVGLPFLFVIINSCKRPRWARV